MHKCVAWGLLVLWSFGAMASSSLDHFRHLLGKRDIAQITTFISKLPYSDLSFSYRFADPGTSIAVPFYNPVLEIILLQMHAVWQKYAVEGAETSKIDSPLAGAHLDKSDLDYFQFLKDVRNLYLQRYRLFFTDAVSRSRFGASTIQDLFYYLDSDEPHFRMLDLYQGRQILFDASGLEKNTLLKAMLKADLPWIMYLYNYLDKTTLPSLSDHQNVLHALLDSKQKLSEHRVHMVLRFILFSERFASKDIVDVITTQNFEGSTPLLLAAKRGFLECFKLLRDYLVIHQEFFEEDHSAPYQLEAELLQGLKKRTSEEALDPRAFAIEMENLKQNLAKPHLAIFDKIDPEQQKRMQDCLLLLRNHLDVAFLKPNTILDLKYKASFQAAVSFWLEHCPGFENASPTIQMSYLEPVLLALLPELLREDDLPIFSNSFLFRALMGSFQFLQSVRHERVFNRIVDSQFAAYQKPLDQLF